MSSEAVLELLKEIENVTQINGCFLLRSLDNSIIESTIPIKIADDILWEIAVLRDTFQQFASGVKHGKLNELMLQGDKGFIFIYNLTDNFILLALGPKQINLPYYKLGMFDIIKRLQKILEESTPQLMALPSKAFAAVGEGQESLPKIITVAKEIEKPTVKESVVKEEIKHIEKPIAEQQVKPIETSVPANITQPVQAIPKEAPVSISESGDVNKMIADISVVKPNERNALLQKIFNTLKVQLPTLTGVQLGSSLEKLKDQILDNIGTSLALFDISKNTRDLMKIQNILPENKVSYFAERIDNWAKRIIK
jgi:predicted regulator of Ras-like GTPase activity (Roadblock/LC7/MglB family)